MLTGGTEDLDGGVFSNIVSCMARLRQTGHDVVLVTSGAIAAGRKSLHCTERPASIPEKQASAAIGQVRLMAKYEACFRKHDQQIAQVLLTNDDLSNRRKFLNARNTLFTLLQCGIIPIINENDSVVVDEIKFGDNDILSALVTNLVDADLLLILTDQDGLYEQDPQRQKDARLIRLVEKVGSAIVDSAKGGTSRLGTGGMRSKVDAAKKASLFGIPTIIVNGRTRKIISRVFAGEEVGTFFLPRKSRLSSRKYWIAFNVKPKVVDGEQAECGGAIVSKLANTPWPKGAFTETSNIWQREWFYITEPRGTKWATIPTFRPGPPLQLASWINKGLDWGARSNQIEPWVMELEVGEVEERVGEEEKDGS